MQFTRVTVTDYSPFAELNSHFSGRHIPRRFD